MTIEQALKKGIEGGYTFRGCLHFQGIGKDVGKDG